MSDDELLKFTDGLSTKLGKEQSAVIADDLGILITKNAETQKALHDKDMEIKALQENNAKLVSANSNLLRQIPMGFEAPKPKKTEEEPKSHFSFKDAFDDKGNFVK